MPKDKSFWSQSPFLNLPRGRLKTAKYREIIIESLRASPAPLSKDALQRASRIKRCRFLIVLNDLLAVGTVIREGTGTRGDRFRYRATGLPKAQE